jgi:hypothetical protein
MHLVLMCFTDPNCITDKLTCPTKVNPAACWTLLHARDQTAEQLLQHFDTR